LSWRNELAAYAPWGHAWLFARTGDFAQAQTLLAEALARGFADCGRRYFLSASVRTRLRTIERLLRQACEGAAEPPAGEADWSFRNSAEIQAVERAVGTLRGFPERERMALVLLYVDEVEEARVREWLQADDAFIADLRKRFEEQAEPGAVERLRQFRLSEAFLSGVLTGIDQERGGGVTLMRVLAWIISLSISAALVARNGSAGILTTLHGMGIPGLFMSVAGVVALFYIQSVYRLAAPETSSDAGSPRLRLSELVTAAAIPLLFAHVIVIFAPRLLLPGGLGRNLFWRDDAALSLAILAVETMALFTMVTRHLPRLTRAALGLVLPRSGD
jgi:hypothetical protein